MAIEGRIKLEERIDARAPKKLLSIDGGGIRGVLALAILAKIEDDLRAATGRNDYVLAEYFDYIAGTSTGGIIAAGLSIGMSVADLMRFYRENGAAMFRKAQILARLRYRFDQEPLAEQLKAVFGEDTLLGSDRLRTLLLLVMRNASTDSSWPICNNPYSKYNAFERADCNARMPLWQLVRASTAAPTYFPPEVITLPGTADRHGKEFVFVDGGVTMYNNPAFQMFLMATMECYWPNAPLGHRGWQTGTEEMLIVSVGTGSSPDVKEDLDPQQMNLLFNATTIPAALMFGALNEQDLLCRVFGDCVAGDMLDRELGSLIGSRGPVTQKLFRYARYNAELTAAGLDALGCGDLEPERVQRLDAIDSIDDLIRVGSAVADKKVHPLHLNLETFCP